jgi:hypothetical protein
MKTDDYWERNLLNAQVYGEAQKEYWLKIEPIMQSLLEELKINGKLRPSIEFTETENNHLMNIFLNRNKIIENFNVLQKGLGKKEEAEPFIEKMIAAGFIGDNFVHLLIEFSAFMTITDLECFKTLVLSCMTGIEDGEYRASKFTTSMKKYAPKSWKKLSPLVMNNFRNALAHGTWTIENGKVVLFSDSRLIPSELLPLDKFMDRTHEISILCNCLTAVIGEKQRAKFFI